MLCKLLCFRSEAALFKLLVEEKTGSDKNTRFVQDFKTLADVLVQEMVKHYLSKKVVLYIMEILTVSYIL